MDNLSFLTEHFSIPAKELVEPAPDKRQLEQILQAAMSAPDHGELLPYRFLVIEGDARQQLALVFEQAARERGADEAAIAKQKAKPLRSPMMVVVIARVADNPTIPDIEQLLCAGAAAQHIQLACRGLGFGSIWLTGDNCYDLTVQQALGLDIDERIIGFIYIGTSIGRTVAKQRTGAKSRTTHWTQPQQSDFAI